MKLRFVFAIGIGSLAATASAFADRVDDLNRRIDELEKQQQEMLIEATETSGQVHSFLRDNLAFGGFFEPAFTLIGQEGAPVQATNSSNILGLNLSAEYDSKIRFVSQVITGFVIPLVNPNSDPRAVSLGQPRRREYSGLIFGSLIAQGYVEYAFSPSFKLQGGLGYVPFGFAYQLREPVLFERRGGPQILRTTQLISPLWSGLHLHGALGSSNSGWGYNVYTTSPAFNPKVPGLGARVHWAPASEKLIVGVSSQVGKISGDTFKSAGADLRLDFGTFQVVTEYIRQFSGRNDPWSAYVQPSVTVFGGDLVFYLHADYANNEFNKTGLGPTALDDPFEKWEYGGGVNWLPTAFTRLRLGVSFNDYVGTNAVVAGQNRDFLSVDASAGVAF